MTATCKHCGEPGVEHALTKDNRQVSTDSCYGCRNRWQVAEWQVALAITGIHDAIRLLQQEDTDEKGIHLADELTKQTTGLPQIYTWIREGM